MSDKSQFLSREEVAGGIGELADECFRVIEQGGGRDGFPEAGEFLQARSIAAPDAGSLQVHHTVNEPGVEPLRPACTPPDVGECVPNCKVINGQQHCVWVCHCSPA